MPKCPKQLQICLKRAETIVVLIVLWCLLRSPRLYCFRVISYRRSTWIRCQKSFIRSV